MNASKSISGSSVITCKVVLIGETGVGKTSIISRYTKNSYNNDTTSTLGASFSSKIMNFPEFDKIIKFDVNILLTLDMGHCWTGEI